MTSNAIVLANPKVRIGQINTLLVPLRPERAGARQPVAAQQIQSQDSTRRIVNAVKEIPFGNGHRDWYFKTFVDGIVGQYFEEWLSDGRDKKWRLSSLCLHICRAPRHERPKEVWAIHCEPDWPGDDIRDRLKRGPHVHVKTAKYPLDRAHIPLNYGHLESVLESLDALTAALAKAIEVASNEAVNAKWMEPAKDTEEEEV